MYNCKPRLLHNVLKPIMFLMGATANPPWKWVAVYRSKGKRRGKRIKWKRIK